MPWKQLCTHLPRPQGSSWHSKDRSDIFSCPSVTWNQISLFVSASGLPNNQEDVARPASTSQPSLTHPLGLILEAFLPGRLPSDPPPPDHIRRRLLCVPRASCVATLPARELLPVLCYHLQNVTFLRAKKLAWPLLQPRHLTKGRAPSKSNRGEINTYS